MKMTITTKMVGLSVFDSTVELNSNDQLYAVIHHIKRQHGSTISHIRLWKSKVEPTTILRDPLQLLSQIFASEDQGLDSSAQHCIYYDFRPREGECAILDVK
ncbi:hypothetical protein JKF63_02408 [Porcisia hertigi]|uniref:Uncharacterized protein n=1 Tax=Porcisia hertigi TaxID=2761500 RepID=A0A836H9G3_9TRYP|nr:hypothetical protein JKF63_02408 [Porcisia hertigi]